MSASTSPVWVTLIAYQVLLLAIGLMAARRTHDHTDFFLAGRRLGPLVAALSANASTSSAWVLLGISGAAYQWGWSAVWLFPGGMLGYVVNWYAVAPRLRALSAARGAVTLTEMLTDRPGPLQQTVVRVASAIVLFSFTFYIAAQFQGAGKSFQSVFDISLTGGVLLATALIVCYTLLGGFWAVSLTDTLQGAVMAATAVVLPLGALAAVGGPGALAAQMAQIDTGGFNTWNRGLSPAAMLGFVGGMLGIGLGAPGQPHVVTRFMALRDDASVTRGRRIALAWAAVVYGGMLVVGWCARVLYDGRADREAMLLVVAGDLFPPVMGGVMVAAVLSASMSTADSQLLAAAGCITHDLMRRTPHKLWHARLVVLLLSLAACATAVFGAREIFGRVLFAWSALGAALGPPLLVTLYRGRPPYAVTLTAMVTGFTWVVVAHLTGARGTVLEAGLPFLVCLAGCWWGTRPETEP